MLTKVKSFFKAEAVLYIASLASLITLTLYLRHPGAQAGRFLAVFTIVNAIGLILLLAVAMLF